MSTRASRFPAVAGLVVALLTAGCAGCGDVDCGVDPTWPRYGERTAQFFDRVANVPDAIAEDVALRGERLGTFGARWWEGRRRELEVTGGRIAGVGPAVADDFRDRGVQLGDFSSRHAARIREDACCFWDRTWHNLKLVLE